MENIINQIVEIENKANEQGSALFVRNIKRLYHEFESKGYKVVNPMNEKYDERDTSLEASILNKNAKTISKVLKPTIFRIGVNGPELIQKGVVIVQ